jgi:hypothetical protein
MFRARIFAPLILCFTSVAVFAEDARQFTCSETMIEPSGLVITHSPETVILTLGPARKIMLDLGRGVMSARLVSDNKPVEVQNKGLRGRVFSLYRRPIFHLQISASDEADVPEA